MAVGRLGLAVREAVARLPGYWIEQRGGSSIWNKELPNAPSLRLFGAGGFFSRQLGQVAVGPGHDLGLGLHDAMWCGRGDKKTKRGKRFKGSFGNPRPTKGSVARRLRQRWQIPPGEPLPVNLQ